MKNKVLIIAVVVMLIVVGVVLSKSGIVNAPTKEDNLNNELAKINVKSQPASQPTSQKMQEPANNQNNSTNDNKTMQLEIKTTQEGTGAKAVEAGDTVAVQYTGKLTDGTKFDSSYDHGGQPFEFAVGTGQVIKGWDQGFLGAKVGEKRTLTIPSNLGYGPNGMGPIPPNATLIFDVEVVSIK